jgi:hypothetical protein
VKHLFNENYKTLMKRFEGETENRKITHVHGLEESILLKWLYYPILSIYLMKFLSNFH